MQPQGPAGVILLAMQWDPPTSKPPHPQQTQPIGKAAVKPLLAVKAIIEFNNIQWYIRTITIEVNDWTRF